MEPHPDYLRSLEPRGKRPEDLLSVLATESRFGFFRARDHHFLQFGGVVDG